MGYAAEKIHGNRLGLWAGQAMDWLDHKVDGIPGDGTMEAQPQQVLVRFYRHTAMDV